MDPATLRRWVNGQLLTLARKGAMTRHTREGSRKTFFTITGDLKKSALAPQAVNKLQRVPKSLSEPQSNSLSSLRDELESHRLKALTELSEIDEYKRIIKQYPDLSVRTKVKFDTAIEENCKTLGRIKALEEILGCKTPKT
jgi:uncharacterized protein YaaR (DUF327 family)